MFKRAGHAAPIRTLIIFAILTLAVGCERSEVREAPRAQRLVVPRVPPPPLLQLTGLVYGLTNGAVLVLNVNGARAALITTDGAYVLLAPQVQGSPYAVTIPYQPVGHVCTLVNAAGRLVPGVLPVTAFCTLATQLGNDLEARETFGQPSGTSAQAVSPPSATTLLQPWGKTYTNDLGVVYVADRGNNRVLGYYPAGTLTSKTASIVLGQNNNFTTSAPGLAADTFHQPCSVQGAGDTLVVTDCSNHRVLIYNSMPHGQAAADVVVGQPDFTTNSPGCSPNDLNGPTSAVILGDQLVIADAGNNRVLFYRSIPTVNYAPADIVLGQASMSACQANRGGLASSNTLSSPQDVGSHGNQFFVTDLGNHRVLGWKYVPIFSGETADLIVGQPDMVTVAVSSTSASSTAAPMYLVSDSQTMFVSDTTSNRVVAFRPLPAQSGRTASYALGQTRFVSNQCNQGIGSPASDTLCGPTGLSYVGGSLVVTDSSNNRLQLYNSDPNAAADAIGYFVITVTPAAGPANANTVAAGVVAQITVTAMNVDDTQNPNYVGTVGLVSSDPNAVLPSTVTLSGTNRGTIVLNANFLTAGNQNVLAVDTNRTKEAGKTNFLVVPGEANYIIVAGFPNPAVVGQPNHFNVTMYDAYHNLATNYVGVVVITSNDGAATLPSPITFSASNMGTASAAFTFGQVGINRITATDANNLLLTGSQVNILTTSTAGQAVTFAFSGYTSPIAAGQQGNVTVTAHDANGLVAVGYLGTAHFTSTDPNAILPPDTVFSQSSQGLAHLSWVFETAGLQTVTAIDTNVMSTTGTSANIVVQGGNAVALAAFNYPNPVTAGQSANITLQAVDAYGNIATRYLGLVKMTITDPYAVASPNHQFALSESGNATFPIAFETAGSWKVEAQDQNTPSLYGEQNQIVVQAASVSFFLLGNIASPEAAGSNQNIFISPRDAYDNLASSYAGTVSITSTDPNASLPAHISFTGGLQTSSPALAFHTMGTWSVTANDTITPSIAGMQNSIVVTSGAATSIRVSGFTNPVVAGQAGNITLMPYDAFGNLVTNYAGTVYITSSDAQAVLPPNVSFNSGNLGVQHAAVTLETSGLQIIDANDTVNLSVAGNQNHIQVNPNTAVRLALSGFPNISNAGQAGNITVTALDAYGNVATGYTGTPHFTSTDANAILPPNTPFVLGDSGIKTFNLTMKTVGVQTIDANDTVTTSIAGAQNTRVVGGTSAAYFVVKNYPTTVSAGQSANVSIWAYDAYGNLATNYTGTVHLTSTDANAQPQSDLTFNGGLAGMANMTVRLITAGLQAINANDVATPSIAGREPNILVNPNVAAILKVAGFPNPANAGSVGNFTITAFDAYGNIATGYTSQVAVTTSDMNAVAPGNYTFTGGDAGVHSLAVNFLTAGNQNIYVTDTGIPAIAGSQRTIVVNGGAVNHFSVLGFPSATTAGTQGNVTVSARDIYNNIVTGYTGTVHLTSSDTNAHLPANLAYVSANAGVAQLPVTLTTVGTWSINANDQGTPSISGRENLIVISSGPATHFKVTAFPATVTAGQQGNVHIAAYDDYNNLATGYTGTVHVTSTDTNAVLPGDLTYTSAAADLPVTLLTAGIRAINANDVASPSIAGNENFIVVNPNVANHLVARTFPSPTTAGAQGNITVTAYDIYNNIATAYTGTVHVTSADANALKPSDFTFAAQAAGTAQLPVTLFTVGNQNIKITDISSATLTSTQPNILVNSGATTHYAVSGYPSPATAGQQGNVTFVALDNYNNVVAGYTGTLHITSTDVAALLPYDFAFRSSDAGILTMPVTLATSGNQAIVGTDYDAPGITGMQNMIVMNANIATHISLSGFATTAVSGGQGNVTVTMRDAYGNVSKSFTGAVNFTSDDTLATYPASTTFAGADLGVRTISLTFASNGNHVLDANSAVTPSIAGQLPVVVVSPNSVTHFIAQNYPSSVIAGQQANITILAVDNFNNVVQSYTGTVQLRSTDANAGLPNNYTFAPADKGNVSFPVTLATVGTRAISANDTGTPSINGFQGGIVVSPNAASRFVLTGIPGASVAGAGNVLTVTAFDNYNNVATTFADVVALSSSDANASLAASSTLTNGVGTFGVTFYTAGTQWLNANDTGNPNLAARQSGIVVSPNTAVALLATAYPTAPIACQAANITITAVDNSNNVVPTYTGTVTLTSSDAAAVLPAAATFAAGNAGVRPLAVTLKTPGAQTITATDAGGLTVTNTNIVVVAGSPNIVVVSAPSTVQPTATFGATVSVYDNCNNLSTAYTGTINLTSTDTIGTPSSTPVAVVFGASDAGIKTVTGLKFKTVTAARALNANDSASPTQISGHANVAVAATSFYADWDYTSAAQASYAYNSSKIDFTSSYAELTPINTQAIDNTSANFGSGTAVNTRWDTGVAAMVQGNTNPNIPALVYLGAEVFDTPTLTNYLVSSSGTYTNPSNSGSPTLSTSGSYYSETPYSGVLAYVLQGNQTVNSGSSTIYMKLIDMTGKNFMLDTNSQLSYWFFPTGPNAPSIAAGNSNYMVVYVQFTDGTKTSSGTYTDSNGHALSPAGQGPHVVSNAWNRTIAKLGAQGLNGKTVDHIGMFWSRTGFTGGFMGWADDIVLTGTINNAQTNNAELAADWTPQYSSIVGYYKFEGVGSIANSATVTATIGSNLTASNSDGNGLMYVAGKIKQGVYLDGIDDYLTIPTSGFPNSSQFSVAAWAKLVSLPVSNYCPRIWTFGANTQNNIDFVPYCASTTSVNTGIFEMKVNSSQIRTTGPQGILGAWVHWVTTYDGTTAKLYFNGQLVSTATFNQSATVLMGSINTIGSSSYSDFWFHGFLDDIAVWNAALSPNDVRLLYERQSAAYSGSLTSRVLTSPYQATGTSSMAWNTTYPASKPLPSDAVSERASAYASNGNSLSYQLEYLWHLDETTAGTVYGGDFLDDTGHGNTAYISGNGGTSSTLNINGRFGPGVYLNSNYIATTTNRATFSAYTVSLWLATVQSGGSGLVSFSDAATGSPVNWDRLMYLTTASTLNAGSWNGSAVVLASGATPVNDGAWHHAVMTYSSGVTTVYLDGALQATAAVNATPTSLNAWWRFGWNTQTWPSSGTNKFVGYMDEIAVWRRALSASEVSQLYRRGGTRFKYRVRTCVNVSCSDNQNFRGPDGTTATYFTEQLNTSGSATMNAWSPNLTLSNYTNLGINANQAYFQYQGLWESDDTNYQCTYNALSAPCSTENTNMIFNRVTYDTTSPSITNSNTINYYTLASFASVLGTTGCSGGVTFTLSPDNTTYYYYTGSAWAASNGSLAQTSTAAQLSAANLATFSSNYGIGKTFLRSYLTSTGISPCSIQSVALSGSQ